MPRWRAVLGMPRGPFGRLRFLLEAAFLLAAAAACWSLGLDWVWIVVVMAAAYLLVVGAEFSVSSRAGEPAPGPKVREGRAPRLRRVRETSHAVPLEELAAQAETEPEPQSGPAPGGELERGLQPQPQPQPQSGPGQEGELEPELQPQPLPQPQSGPGQEGELEPEREPELVLPPRPPLAAVPEPEPEPEPEPTRVPESGPMPMPEPQRLAPRGPREWNLWDLERLSRAHAGDDASRDEERSYLLMYLREFADANGILPADFDGLVRDTFGDLVGAR